MPGIDLEYDLTISLHVTAKTIYDKFINILPFFMNVAREGWFLVADERDLMMYKIDSTAKSRFLSF